MTTYPPAPPEARLTDEDIESIDSEHRVAVLDYVCMVEGHNCDMQRILADAASAKAYQAGLRAASIPVPCPHIANYRQAVRSRSPLAGFPEVGRPCGSCGSESPDTGQVWLTGKEIMGLIYLSGCVIESAAWERGSKSALASW